MVLKIHEELPEIKQKKNILNILIEGVKKDYKYFLENNIPIENRLFKTPMILKTVIGDKLIKSFKEKEEKGIYEIMQDDINNIFDVIVSNNPQYEKNEIENNGKIICNYQDKTVKKSSVDILKLDKNKLDLSIYIRYGNRIEYPEIAEYITLFINKYINEGYSKYFSNIRIIPRIKGKYPNFIDSLKLDNISLFNNEGELFESALHDYSVAYRLSHGSNSNPNNTPGIVSNLMDSNKGDVKSKIELKYKNNNKKSHFVQKATLLELFLEVVNDIKQIENELDQIVDNEETVNK